MKFKKVLAPVALSLILAFGAVACGSNNDASTDNDKQVESNSENNEDSSAKPLTEEEYIAQIEKFVEAMDALEGNMDEIYEKFDALEEDSGDDRDAAIDAALDAIDEFKNEFNVFDEFLAIDNPPEKYADAHNQAKEGIQKLKDFFINFFDDVGDIMNKARNDENFDIEKEFEKLMESYDKDFEEIYVDFVDGFTKIGEIYNGGSGNKKESDNKNASSAEPLTEDEYYAQVEKLVESMDDIGDNMTEIGERFASVGDLGDDRDAYIDVFLEAIKDCKNEFGVFDEFLAIENPPEKYAEAHNQTKEGIQKFKDFFFDFLDDVEDMLIRAKNDKNFDVEKEIKALEEKMESLNDEAQTIGEDFAMGLVKIVQIHEGN